MRGHETGIPVGNWRYLVVRLERTAPNDGNRCVGAGSGALASAKQVRIALSDVSQPTLKIGGSLLSGAELRGPQTVDVAGGKTITAGFAGNKRKERTLPFRRRALIRGRLLDSNGQPVAGAQVCIQAHTDLPGRSFHLAATTTTNQNGGWSYKSNRGPSRIFRVGYRSGAFEVAESLALRIRSRSTLHLSAHRSPINKKVFFSGELPGPSCAGRTAFVKATVRGATRKVLVRQATTDPLCHFRIGYAFSPIPRTTRFVVWVYVPEQVGYPYRPGRSVNRYIRVNPHPPQRTKHSHRR